MTAFLLTWKESGWPHENIERMVRALDTQGHVDEPWRIAAHNMAKPGDRVWALRQGRGPKGIFGAGHILAPPALGEAGNGETRWMAPVRFEAFVDPLQNLLIGEDAVAGILRPTQLRAQASGYPMDDEQSAALEELLATSPAIELGGSGDWTPAEVQATVDDYFAMLNNEVAGRSYSKTEHRNALRERMHRSPGSIERKHQNISAVLQELGLPWIDGYKPLPNFQDALVDAVEAHLGGEIERLDHVPPPPPPPPAEIDVGSVFVAPPPAAAAPKGRSMARVARRFDAAARDATNRALGVAGESFVMEVEKKRLASEGRADLAARVAWVSRDRGDGLGYDIESFDADGRPVVIEVKTTKGGIATPFFVSENERCVAVERGATFRLYRVFGRGGDRKVYCLKGPLEGVLALEPVTYRARVANGG
jgi:hypothetical protein